MVVGTALIAQYFAAVVVQKRVAWNKRRILANEGPGLRAQRTNNVVKAT